MELRREMTEAQTLAHLVARLTDATALLEHLVLETRAGGERYESLRQRAADLLRDVRCITAP